MTCDSCYNRIKRGNKTKPPQYELRNGWVVGSIPLSSVVEDIDDLLCAMASGYRYFAYVFTYFGGADKSIQGHHSFFENDPENVGATLNYVRNICKVNNVFVMLK